MNNKKCMDRKSEIMYRISGVYAYYERICEITGKDFDTRKLDNAIFFTKEAIDAFKETNELCEICGRNLLPVEVALWELVGSKHCGWCVKA